MFNKYHKLIDKTDWHLSYKIVVRNYHRRAKSIRMFRLVCLCTVGPHALQINDCTGCWVAFRKREILIGGVKIVEEWVLEKLMAREKAPNLGLRCLGAMQHNFHISGSDNRK